MSCVCCPMKVRHLPYHGSVVHAKDRAVRILQTDKPKKRAKQVAAKIGAVLQENPVFTRMVMREIDNFPDDMLGKL